MWNRIARGMAAAAVGGALFLCACGGVSLPAETASTVAPAYDPPMPQASGESVLSGEGVTVDASHTDQGYVMIKSDPRDKRLKARLSGNEQTYTYEQPTDDSYQTYPLQMGDGAYTVQAFEQVEGSTYTRIFNKKLTVQLSDPNRPFLYPNQYVNYTGRDAAIAKSHQLAAGMTDKAKIAKKMYDYVVKTVAYDYEKAESVKKGYLPVPDETLSTGKGICFDYSALLAAMLRAQGIPTRLEIGYVAPDNLYHAWNRAYIDGTWVFFDATLAGEGRKEQDYTTERVY